MSALTGVQTTEATGEPGGAEPDELRPDADELAGPWPVRRSPWRRAAGWLTTVLAAVLLLFALIGPDQFTRFSPAAFVRLPVEGLIVVVLVLVLPRVAGRIVAGLAGLLLGLVTIVKCFDMGFYAAFDRPFDPVSDWSFLGPAVDFLRRSIGRTGSIAAEIAAILLAGAALSLMTLAALRLARLMVAHRNNTARTVAVLGVTWVVLAVVGVQAAGGPVASTSAAGLAYGQVKQARADLADQKSFPQLIADDDFRNTPANQLLTGLRGKNVLLTFVESYGRVAIQGSDIAPQIDALLDHGTSALKAAGFTARSAFLTSSTYGGGSWLAHSTLQSGLWIDTQQRYNQLVTTNRLTLASAFARAGWRTVGMLPADNADWPEGKFYGYDQIYDSRNMGYKGPPFSFASIPDQYTMEQLQRTELAAPNQTPVMTEIDLLSSHAPWEPVPKLLDWNKIGDGSVYGTVKGGTDPTDTVFKQSASKVRGDYGETIAYTLDTLISYLENYVTANTVMVFLGDHQPATVVTGDDTSRDVPITIVAKDPTVFDHIAGWGWQDGLRPDPQAPVWRMDTFRDRFLTAFGSQPSLH